MSAISTHVLDTARGKPASDVPVRLEREEAPERWKQVGAGRTDQSGRCAQLLGEGENLAAGNYRLSFDTKRYFAAQKIDGLYPHGAGCFFRERRAKRIFTSRCC